MTAHSILDADGMLHTFDEHGHEQYPLTDLQIIQLLADLSKNRIAHRNAGGDGEGGRQLSYLEAWDVRRTLIRIFGFGGWSAKTTHTLVLKIETDVPRYTGRGENRTQSGVQFRVLAQTTTELHIHQLGTTYTETAAASQTNPDIGEATDFAIKTAESDALKRAAVNLGTQFGLSLYDNGTTSDGVQRTLAPGQTLVEVQSMRFERRALEAKVIEDMKKQAKELGIELEQSKDEQLPPDQIGPIAAPEQPDDEGTQEEPGETLPPTESQLDAGHSTVQAGFAHPEAKS